MRQGPDTSVLSLAQGASGCINRRMSDPYAPMQEFTRPARGGHTLGQVIWVFAICEALIIFGPLLMVGLIPNKAMVEAFFQGTTPMSVLAQFASFGISAIGMVLVIKRVHGRGFWSLVGVSPATAVVDAWLCAKAVALVLLVQVVLPPWVNVAELAYIAPLPVWLIGLPFAVVVIVIQAGTEELLFRGYLQQQLGAISKSRWVWLV